MIFKLKHNSVRFLEIKHRSEFLIIPSFYRWVLFGRERVCDWLCFRFTYYGKIK